MDRHWIIDCIPNAEFGTFSTWILGGFALSVGGSNFVVFDYQFHDTRNDLAVWKRWVILIWQFDTQNTVNFTIVSGSTFLSHKIFEFLGRISFTTYSLNPLVIMVFVFSCEQAFHVDVLGLMPSIIGFYGVTILASLAFILLIEYPISRIIHSLLWKSESFSL